MVVAIESWLGVVFVLVAVAGIGMTGRWLPRAVLVTGAMTLLVVAAVNPERLIADRNVDRYEETGQLDAEYLLRLSSDVQAALDRLPEDMQMCAVYRAMDRGPWYEFNLSRWRATHDNPSTATCPQYGEVGG
jgi:hypothetical protein